MCPCHRDPAAAPAPFGASEPFGGFRVLQSVQCALASNCTLLHLFAPSRARCDFFRLLADVSLGNRFLCENFAPSKPPLRELINSFSVGAGRDACPLQGTGMVPLAWPHPRTSLAAPFPAWQTIGTSGSAGPAGSLFNLF